jgi:methionine aminopeptidase
MNLRMENINKYRLGGKIISSVLDRIIKEISIEKNIYKLCRISDNYLLESLEEVSDNYGISFPTSISINNIAGFNRSDTSNIEIGDLVKIEMGVHIDNFPSIICFTYLNGETNNDKIKNVLNGVSEASKKVIQTIRTGKTNKDIADIIANCASKYNCSLLTTNNINIKCPSIISYQMSKGIIDGHNDDISDDVHSMIVHKECEHYDFGMRETEFIDGEVFCIDIGMSSGIGKLIESDNKNDTTLFKKTGNFRGLKLKSSKEVVKYFNESYPSDSENIKLKNSAKNMGLIECVRNNVLEPYPVYREKKNEYIARAKFTVIIKDNKSVLVTGRSLDPELKKLN